MVNRLVELKLNMLGQQKIKKNEKVFYLIDVASADFGTFSFFSDSQVDVKYLKEFTAEFVLNVYNNQLSLKYVGIKF